MPSPFISPANQIALFISTECFQAAHSPHTPLPHLKQGLVLSLLKITSLIH